MEAFLLYTIKSSILIALFWSCYRLLLAKDTLFWAHRWFLFLGLIIALILPIITFTQTLYVETTPIKETALTLSSPETFNHSTDWFFYLGMVYMVGCCFFAGRLILQIASMYRVITSGRKSKKQGISYVETNRAVSPFSFIKYVIYNPSHYSKDELKVILEHERIHVKGLHSIDVLCTLILLLLQWFNPFAWWYKKAVQQNLEFIADKDALATGLSSQEYQYLLLKANFNTNQFSSANTFFNSLIKKRISMINRKRTSSTHLFKYGFTLPFLIVFIFLFNVSTEAKVILQTPIKSVASSSDLSARTYTITKTTTHAELETLIEKIKKENGTLTLSTLKRNEEGEIIALALEYKLSSTHLVTGNYANFAGISTIFFGINENGGVFVSTIDNSNEVSTESQNTVAIRAAAPSASSPSDSTDVEDHALGMTTGIQPFEAKPLIIMNGKEVPYATLGQIRPQEIHRINVLKGPYASRKFGRELKNGAIEVTTKKSWESSVGTMATHPEKNSVTKPNNQTNTTSQPEINQARIVIEGKESSTEALEEITPDKVESVTPIKEKEVVEKQGEKARNGVIEIRPSNGEAIPQAQHPLIVIDGEVSSQSALKDLDRDRIKAMNVLKGENAFKKYGDKAEHGAVEITTFKK